MTLERVLQERRRAILDDWLQSVIETYPEGMWDRLRKGRDRFANPIGGTVTELVESLFDALLRRAEREELILILDTTIRLRAVQSFTPAQAVGFVFDLKRAVRRALAREIRTGRYAEELSAFECRVDEAALVAFDGYMSCREQLMRVRANEARGLTRRLIERAGLSFPDPRSEESPSGTEHRRRGGCP